MFISDFAIRRPIVTVVTMLALVAFGLAALFKLQTDEFPDIQAPIVFVSVGYPGAAPDIVEREVVDRIEDRLSGISGVDKINSTTTDEFAQIIVQFVFEKPVDLPVSVLAAFIPLWLLGFTLNTMSLLGLSLAMARRSSR